MIRSCDLVSTVNDIVENLMLENKLIYCYWIFPKRLIGLPTSAFVLG